MTVFILDYSTNQGPSIAQKTRAGGPNFPASPPFGIGRSVRAAVEVLGVVFTRFPENNLICADSAPVWAKNY